MEYDSDIRSNHHSILILGGGFAGVYAAYEMQKTLSGLDVDVAIVNRDNSFVYYPLLPEIVSGAIETESILNPIRQVVKKADLYVGEAVEVDLDNQRVRINHGLYGHRQYPRTLTYDHLVLALGGVPNTEPVEGLGDHGYDVQRLGHAFSLRNHLIDTLEQADIEADPEAKKRLLTYVVIGGGATGVEVAAEIWDLFMEATDYYPRLSEDDIHVILVHGSERLIPDLPERLGEYAGNELVSRGIDIRFNERVTRVSADWVELRSGEIVPTRTTIGSIGLRPNPLIADLDVPHDDRGRVQTNRDLTIGEYPNLWGIGDNAMVENPHTGDPYPQTAQHAVRQGKLVAQNLAASIRGKETERMEYRTRGQMVPLGRRKAVADIRGYTLSGFPAWWMWRTYYLFQLPRWAKRIRVAFDWTAGLLFAPDIVQLKVGQTTPPGKTSQQRALEEAHAGED
jgi:NADH:ubiquinone reductase (H+-translocating)